MQRETSCSYLPFQLGQLRRSQEHPLYPASRRPWRMALCLEGKAEHERIGLDERRHFDVDDRQNFNIHGCPSRGSEVGGSAIVAWLCVRALCLCWGCSMRPQGEVRVALAAALIDGPGTTRELAARVGCSAAVAMVTLRDMVAAGDARKTFKRVPGVCRPVPVYHRSVRCADLSAAREGLQSLIAAWAAIPVQQPMEAVM